MAISRKTPSFVGALLLGALVFLGERPAFGQGASYKVVAFAGQAAPGGGTYASFQAPRVGQNGSVGFVAQLASEGDGERVFAGQPQGLQLIASLNEVAPGTGGATFSTFSNLSLNSAGQAAFNALAVTEGSFAGIWAGNSPSFGIAEGSTLDGAAGGLVDGVSAPSFNARNQIAAKVTLAAFSESFFGPTSALAVGSPGKLSVVLGQGSAAPGFSSGTTIFDLFEGTNDRPDQNDAGVLAFKASVAASPGPTPPKIGVIYLGKAGKFTPVAVEQASAPGIAGAVYSELAANPSLSSDGKVAFVAGLNSSLDSVVPNEAVFAGAPGAIQPIVREGDLVPDGHGAKFSSFSAACVNETGDVVFQANIVYPNESTRPGLWVKRISGPPVLLAASGVTFETPGGPAVAQNVGFAGPGTFNDLHQVAFWASFAGGQGIYLADTRAVAPWVRPVFPRKPRDRVTREKSITIRGTAQDETGIAKVEYTVVREGKSRGKSRKHGVPVPHLAKGDRRWSFDVPLALGNNRISVRATDKLGNVSEPLVLVILRY